MKSMLWWWVFRWRLKWFVYRRLDPLVRLIPPEMVELLEDLAGWFITSRLMARLCPRRVTRVWRWYKWRYGIPSELWDLDVTRVDGCDRTATGRYFLIVGARGFED